MTIKEAQTELQYALENQKTIEITKLKEIMRVLKIAPEVNENQEIEHLRNEIKGITIRANAIHSKLNKMEYSR